MSGINRRNVLRVGLAAVGVPAASLLNVGCSQKAVDEPSDAEGPTEAKAPTDDQPKAEEKKTAEGSNMKVQYLEIVTPEVDAACDLYSQMHGVTFGEPIPHYGGARTAKLADGGMLGIRGPLRETEKPVVRPYLLVKDIAAAVAAAEKTGAEIAMPPTEIPGEGKFAIVIQGGIESGLWQL